MVPWMRRSTTSSLRPAFSVAAAADEHAAARASAATSGGAKRAAPRTLHPEHAELRVLDRRVHRGGEREAEHAAGVLRRDHAVVPQTRRGVVGMALAVVLLEDGLLERLFLLLRPGPAL